MNSSSPTAPASSNYRWVICGLLFFATTINYMDRQVISYLKEDEFTQAIIDRTPVVRHQVAYQITPKGLEVEYDR